MICPNCKTENGYTRLILKQWVCRKCGEITPLPENELNHPKEENNEEGRL